MKHLLLLAALTLVGRPAFCQSSCCAPPSPALASAHTKPAALMAGLGDLHHPVSTRNPLAQRFFDQGLTLVYAFNHEEAVRSFQRATQLAPDLAMAHWGVALALGPNINMDIDPPREQQAYREIQKAKALEAGASEEERAYIEALAARYSQDPKADLPALSVAYKIAMGGLVKRYPDDLDAATLYAESAMDLHPWQLWALDGTPTVGTPEIVSTLESVLRRDPNHIGANHYYIHTVEASPHPEQALACADRLPGLAPAAGHLVHMPAHVYMRVGDYEAASTSNEAAVAADQSYLKQSGASHLYGLMYYSHNLDFLRSARCMEGRYADAKRAADLLAANVRPALAAMPMVEGMTAAPALVLVRFGHWGEIQKLAESPSRYATAHATWLYARGMADAATGNTARAATERTALQAAVKALPAGAMAGLNSTQSVLQIADLVLGSRIALAQGDRKAAIGLLTQAVAAQDAQAYDEPVDWYYSVRESLGGALLQNGQAAEAEAVFRADLERNPRSGRSLFGLWQSLKAQNKAVDAAWVETEYRQAWQHADTPLTVAAL